MIFRRGFDVVVVAWIRLTSPLHGVRPHSTQPRLALIRVTHDVISPDDVIITAASSSSAAGLCRDRLHRALDDPGRCPRGHYPSHTISSARTCSSRVLRHRFTWPGTTRPHRLWSRPRWLWPRLPPLRRRVQELPADPAVLQVPSEKFLTYGGVPAIERPPWSAISSSGV